MVKRKKIIINDKIKKDFRIQKNRELKRNNNIIFKKVLKKKKNKIIIYKGKRINVTKQRIRLNNSIFTVKRIRNRNFKRFLPKNYDTSIENRTKLKKYKKKRKLRRTKKLKILNFYFNFPNQLNKSSIVNRFYRINLKLLNITYELLLGFHTAIGNSFKTWVNPTVFSNIIGIRNEMILYDMNSVITKLKKGLQFIFHVSKFRGSILGFIDIKKNYKFSGLGFNHFLRTWLPGYLSNYRRVVRNLLSLDMKRKYTNLTRRQEKFFIDNYMKKTVEKRYYMRYFRLKKKFAKKGIPPQLKSRIPAIPQFSFSLEDNNIWVNECQRVGVRTLAVCDTESFPHKIDYAIIANQKSIPLGFFIVKMISESIKSGKRMDYLSFIGLKFAKKLKKKND